MLPDNVLFSNNPAHDLSNLLSQKKYSQIGVLVDEHTRKDCYPIVKDALSDDFVIEVKSGEEQKTLQTCTTIWQEMTDRALDRHACLIVLGGGVLGDMGGFCAATYKRGIDFILIPTTLLAQVDASVGGKLGVDFNTFKNHIGVFQQPVLTLIHSGFLKTLPQAELRSGFAEVIKHTLISDRAMWDVIRRRTLHEQDWEELLKHSVTFKAGVTTQDPKEKGLRKILNAGHTIGHAVESYLLGTGHRILHGEAIAVGLITEGLLALERGLLDARSFEQMASYVLAIFGKVNLTNEMLDDIAALAAQDKKNKDNKILCVLLDGVGQARWDCVITPDDIKRALAFYQSLQT